MNNENPSEYLAIKHGTEVIGFVRKDQVLGASYAVDDEWVLEIYLKNGNVMKVGVGSRGDSDRLLEMLSDLGWP
jgi:hypothetical protein